MNWENMKAFFGYHLGYVDDRDLFLNTNFYKGYQWYPSTSKRSVDDLEMFEADESDVLVVTYPKSGTHWMIEIVKLVLADGYPERVANRKFEEFPLETIHFNGLPDIIAHNATKTCCSYMKTAPSPKVIISHMPLKFVPPSFWKNNAKIVYVARNFKDLVVSLYNFQKDSSITTMVKDFPSLLEAALEGNIPYNGWFEHIQEYWKVRDRPNVLFVTYEEMQKDLRSVVEEVSNLLGHEVSDEGMQRIMANSEIKKMRENLDKSGLSITRNLLKMAGAGDFMNKGVSGQWKKKFTVEQSEEVDRVLSERMKGYEELKQRLSL